MAKKPETATRIADNKKAAYNYFFEERLEAGLVLEGWEVKSLREGKVQLTDGYVVVREGELFIIGLQIHPLNTASTHISPDKVRTRKLLLHKVRSSASLARWYKRVTRWFRSICIGKPEKSSAKLLWPRARPSMTSATPSKTAKASARSNGR